MVYIATFHLHHHIQGSLSLKSQKTPCLVRPQMCRTGISYHRTRRTLNKMYMLPHSSALLLPVSLTGVMNISPVDKRDPSAVKQQEGTAQHISISFCKAAGVSQTNTPPFLSFTTTGNTASLKEGLTVRGCQDSVWRWMRPHFNMHYGLTCQHPLQ